MSDGEFDGIVIGSGYNGLTTAGYLAKQGYKMLVLERRLQYGGATITEEVTRPGFYHNLHANFVWSYGPPHQDFELHKYGLKLMRSEVERCFLFDDGATLTTYTDDPERGYKQFAQLLPKSDLETLEEVYHRFLTKVEEEFYAPPKPNDERGGGLPDDDRSEYQKLCAMTGREVIDTLYESDRLKTFISMNACVRGMPDFAPGTGDFFLRYAASPKLSIIRGGTCQLAHALAAFVHQHGGVVLNGYDVERITIEGGRAVGVECANGASFRARNFVVSGIDPPGTFLRLVGEEHTPEAIVARCNEWEIENHTALFGLHAAVDVAPDYTPKYPEDANRALAIFMGVSSLEELDAHWEQIDRGFIPEKLGGDACCHTMIDPSYAPPGKHTLLFWQFGPPADKLGGGSTSYDEIKEDLLERMAERWREYAPNLSKDTFLGKYAYTPADIEQRIVNMVGGGCRQGAYTNNQWGYTRPFPEANSYRTPVEALYLCGSGCHPGGSIHFGPGYNCANAIAEDLTLEKWWPPYRIQGKPMISSGQQRPGTRRQPAAATASGD
jgi:phytoene dehydrogenase-like protein